MLEDRGSRARHEHVDRRHDEQREQRADDHPADQHDADAVAGAGARSGRQDEREVTDDGSRGRHQNGAQSRDSRLDDRAELVQPCLLQVVRELHDEDAVLRYQSDQRDQSDLAVDVERRQSKEREEQRPGNCQRHRARQDDEGIAEALELGREDQINQDRRQQEGAEKTAALGPELARLAGVIDREALRQDGPGFVFEQAQRPIERHRRRDHSLHPHGVELLELLQLARLGGRPQTRERRQRHELVAGSRDVNLRQLIGRETLGTLDLRNHLVAAALNAEAVDIVAAEQD